MDIEKKDLLKLTMQLSGSKHEKKIIYGTLIFDIPLLKK